MNNNQLTSYDVEALVAQWIECWNSHDVEAAYNLFDEQFEFYSSFLKGKDAYPDGKINSKQELKRYFQKIIQSIPDLQLQVRNIEVENQKVKLHFYSATENLLAKGSIDFNENGKIEKSKFEFEKDTTFASRTSNLPKSFLKEILKVTKQPEIISFAGGLPNPQFFPVNAIDEATHKVLSREGSAVLQYATSEGYQPLRAFIADRYQKKKGLSINEDNIIITNGSQQALDLVAKLFINQGDPVLLEKPSYLGAIQAYSVFEPTFHMVELQEDGVNSHDLKKQLQLHKPKLFYVVPNFQNPTGISYSEEKRKECASLLQDSNTWLIEDDPYGEIRFIGEEKSTVTSYLQGQSVLCGSFSKIVAPGLRLGWMVVPDQILSKVTILKQATDLHSNYFSQRVLSQYLQDNDIDQHIQLIKDAYKKQRNLMLAAIDEYFPEEVKVTRPEGGMFLWATLPQRMNSIEVFKLSQAKNVAFVPGRPFYTSNDGYNTMRLNFSNAPADKIDEGIKRLAEALKYQMVH